MEVGSYCHWIGGKPLAEVEEKKKREQGRRRKVGLITSCIFKQAHSPRGEESSILGETHEKEEDMRRQTRKKGGELVSEVEVRSCWADAGGVMGGRK